METFSLIFSDTTSNGSSLLVHWNRIIPASGNEVFIKSFITTSVYGFWVNFKPCAFIQSFFFCCWKALLKLGVNQFSPIFSVPNSGSSFSSGNEFSIKYYSYPWRGTDFLCSVLLFNANFVLVETIFYVFFIYIFLPLKIVFRPSGNVFFSESWIFV